MRRLVLALALLATPALAQTDPRVARSIALRDEWQWLTRDIAFPAEWDADGRHFHYRKTVAGGFAFVEVDPATQAKRAPSTRRRWPAGWGRRWRERSIRCDCRSRVLPSRTTGAQSCSRSTTSRGAAR